MAKKKKTLFHHFSAKHPTKFIQRFMAQWWHGHYPSLFSGGAKELPIQVQSALALVTGQQVSEHLAVTPRPWRPWSPQIRHHFSPFKKALKIHLGQIAGHIPMVFTVPRKPSSAWWGPTWFCICNCATIWGGRAFPASVSSICRSWWRTTCSHMIFTTKTWV